MRLVYAMSGLVLAAAMQARAQSFEEMLRPTLAGLPSVVVSLSHISEDLARAGVDSSTVRTDVELRLRFGKVPILGASEYSPTPTSRAAVLSVDVSAIRLASSRGWAVHVQVELHQYVRLLRDSSITVAPTWRSRGTYGVVPDAQEIRRLIRDQVDQFVNAYRFVNEP